MGRRNELVPAACSHAIVPSTNSNVWWASLSYRIAAGKSQLTRNEPNFTQVDTHLFVFQTPVVEASAWILSLAGALEKIQRNGDTDLAVGTCTVKTEKAHD